MCTRRKKRLTPPPFLEKIFNLLVFLRKKIPHNIFCLFYAICHSGELTLQLCWIQVEQQTLQWKQINLSFGNVGSIPTRETDLLPITMLKS